MFDIDRWTEVITSIRKNLLRTILAGATIAMGLFIFILLFGIGNGLQNGFMQQFVDDATNVIYISSRSTTKAYGGYQEGRRIDFENKDYDFIQDQYADKIEHQTLRIYDNVTAKFNTEYGSYSVRAVTPEHQYLEKTIIKKGRYLQESDINNKEKFIVIGRLVEKDLFKNQSSMGKYLALDGINFKVIGVFADDGGDNEERIIYLPYTTQQILNKSSKKLDQINLTYQPSMKPSQAMKFGEELEKALKKRLIIHPEDDAAIRVRNNAENLDQTFAFLLVLTIIVLFIGFGTLIAGVIGISNIMVYIVKERTKEIGIRKALGARRSSIVGMILHEAILITLFSGIVGMLLAILTLNWIGNQLEDYFIMNPSVETTHIVLALLVLISGGILAGFIPAYRAAKVPPVEALRTE